MADLNHVRARLATAHTALEAGAQLLDGIKYTTGDSSEAGYIQRELHKILGRLEALDAGLAFRAPARQRRRGKEAPNAD